MKRSWTAIVEDGNGKIHIFRQTLNESTREPDAFEARMHGLSHALGGCLLALYRNADVIERQNWREC